MSDFGLPERGRNTEYWLQQANVFRMQLLGGAGADHIMQSIANDVGAWMPRLENALAADNMVQYKGFLEGLLGRVVDLEQQMLQQPAPNAAKVATARQLVDALQKSYASLYASKRDEVGFVSVLVVRSATTLTQSSVPRLAPLPTVRSVVRSSCARTRRRPVRITTGDAEDPVERRRIVRHGDLRPEQSFVAARTELGGHPQDLVEARSVVARGLVDRLRQVPTVNDQLVERDDRRHIAW